MTDDWQVASEKPAPKAPPPSMAGWEIQQEKPAIPENYGFTASHMAEQGWKGLKQLGSSLDEMAKDLVFPKGETESDKLKFLANKYIFDPADREQVLAQSAPDALTSIGHSIAQALPLVGPWAASLGEQAGTGDVGGAAARGATQVAAAKAAPAIVKGAGVAAGMAREAVGGAIHTPEGELTTGADIAGKVGGGAAGAAAGSLVGHEYLGAAAGYKLGPSLLDRMFPEPDAAAAARETFQSTKEITEAHESALKEAESRANAERVQAARDMRDAKNVRDAELEARDKKAQDLMDRQAAQDKLDAAEIRTTNAAMRAKRMAEADVAKEGKAVPMTQSPYYNDYKAALKAAEDAAQEAHDARTETATKYPELQGNPTPFQSPTDLISRTKKIVKPGEAPSAEDLKRAGDFTQVPLSKLQQLASWGDELAKNEIKRRLRNQ